MAWMSQEKKAQIAPNVKAIMKKYNMKGSLSVRNHSTLCLTIKSGSLDLISNYNETMADKPKSEYWTPAKSEMSLNPYWYNEHFSGKSLEFLEELFTAMNDGNHDRSDIQSDYFDVGWYVNVSVGAWNKPFVVA